MYTRGRPESKTSRIARDARLSLDGWFADVMGLFHYAGAVVAGIGLGKLPLSKAPRPDEIRKRRFTAFIRNNAQIDLARRRNTEHVLKQTVSKNESHEQEE